jgi:hypothetical protein
MGDGLDTAAVEIEVGDGGGAKNAKGVVTLGGEVDVGCGVERRGGDEKDFLCCDEAAGHVVDLCTNLPHD